MYLKVSIQYTSLTKLLFKLLPKLKICLQVLVTLIDFQYGITFFIKTSGLLFCIKKKSDGFK